MKLYFLRHAHAEDATGVLSDHDRKLTSKGVKAAGVVARLLHALEVEPDQIFTSPRLRAQQTAEIVATTLGLTIEVRDEVNFGFGIESVKKLIERFDDDSEVMFVGHEPTFSLTIGEITGGRVQMKKAGIARVDLLTRQPLKGELVWLIPPKVTGVLDE
ncbi:MAG: phosphohistidine phosphatase SixA [Anaerolineae bacterium]|nr:phosphohistidine phosphatase SixA [Anaerolineae bacterium]